MSKSAEAAAQERYDARREIADDIQRQIDEAAELLGPAKTYGVHVIRDKTGVEPDRRFYCCQREGQLGWHPTVEQVFDRHGERRTDKYVEHPQTGERCYYFRYSQGTAALEAYNPHTPEQMLAAAAKRKAKKRAAELEQYPMFSDQIQSEHEREDHD